MQYKVLDSCNQSATFVVWPLPDLFALTLPSPSPTTLATTFASSAKPWSVPHLLPPFPAGAASPWASPRSELPPSRRARLRLSRGCSHGSSEACHRHHHRLLDHLFESPPGRIISFQRAGPALRVQFCAAAFCRRAAHRAALAFRRNRPDSRPVAAALRYRRGHRRRVFHSHRSFDGTCVSWF